MFSKALSIAFAACLVLIFILMTGWFRSLLTLLIVMMALPFLLSASWCGIQLFWSTSSNNAPAQCVSVRCY